MVYDLYKDSKDEEYILIIPFLLSLFFKKGKTILLTAICTNAIFGNLISYLKAKSEINSYIFDELY